MSDVSEHSDSQFYFPEKKKKKKKKVKRGGHMIKCLLTELGRAGRENIWPEGQIFSRPARPNSVNKYIVFLDLYNKEVTLPSGPNVPEPMTPLPISSSGALPLSNTEVWETYKSCNPRLKESSVGTKATRKSNNAFLPQHSAEKEARRTGKP